MFLLQPTLSRPVVMIVLGATPFIVFLLPSGLDLVVDRPGQPLVCGVACMGVQMLAGVSGPLLVLDHMSDGHFRSATQHLVLAMGGCYLASGIWLLR
jgi:hypothetical protein